MARLKRVRPGDVAVIVTLLVALMMASGRQYPVLDNVLEDAGTSRRRGVLAASGKHRINKLA
jgi:hypothetical protein